MTATSMRDTGEVPGDEQPHALIERRGAVLTVTMNRPTARNALTGPMMALMRQAWDLTDSHPGIRVCVLTGAGGAFCAGADVKAMTSAHPDDAFRAGELDLSVIEPLLKGRRLTKPLIAAVEGPALGRALEIAAEIAANGPVAVRAILRVIRETEGMAENEAFALEAREGMAVFASEDAKEGPRAFAEKRRPQFRDG